MVGGIDFQDLALFNDSILVKKTWRLLHNDTSLFPYYTIMEENDFRSGFYAWRSILHGQDVFLKGGKMAL